MRLEPAAFVARDEPQRDISPSPWTPVFAGVSALNVEDFQVAGTRYYHMRRLFPTQAWDKPPRYIFLSAKTGVIRGSAKRGWAQMLSMLIESPIRGWDSGQAFKGIAHPGCRRHTKV